MRPKHPLILVLVLVSLVTIVTFILTRTKSPTTVFSAAESATLSLPATSSSSPLLFSPTNQPVTTPISLAKQQGQNVATITPPSPFQPGVYTLKTDQGSQTFPWGVLVLNTDQDKYSVGQTAQLQIASLDEHGRTLCNSNLELRVDGQLVPITKSSDCGADNVTDIPDYTATYIPRKEGDLRVVLTNLDNNWQITSALHVTKSPNLIIKRLGATRINPFKAQYLMQIEVTSSSPQTVDITESLPLGFTSTSQVGSNIVWNSQKLDPETPLHLSYTYQAERLSPAIFALGPLAVGDQHETRTWQLASDAPDSAYSHQRKTWYDGTRYWRSYYDSTDARIEFEYSSDGTSWTENTSARITASSSDFSLDADSGNAFVTYTVSNDIKGRTATSYPGTSFSWGSEQIILDGSGSTKSYTYPVIARDSSGYVHVAARQNDSLHYYISTIKETSAANDLPEDSGDTVKSIGNLSNTNPHVYAVLSPLTTQNMYITFAMGTTIAGCKWVNSSTQWQNSSGGSCEDDPAMYSGLVGWWELEEAGDADRADSSGNNNTLTESASDTVAQVSGKFGYGADLERDDTEYLAITDAAQTGLDLGVNFTLSAWLNVESDVSGGGTNQGVITRADSNGNWAYAMRTEDTSICGMINDTGYAGDGSEPCSTSSMFSLATWTLFTITYDGATMRLYKNGSEQTSGDWPLSTTVTPKNSNGSFELGRWGSQNGYYDGILDDVRVYNRTLTSTEVSTLNSYNPANAGLYDTIDTGVANLQDTFSAVGDGSGNVYLEYIDDESTDQVSVVRYNGTSWGSAALVPDAADNNDSYPTLTYDSTGSDLYAFWIDTSSSDIYYSKCDVSTSCDTASEWDSEVAWQTSGANTYVTSNYSGDGKVFAQWLDGTTIAWDDVSFNTPPSTPSLDSPADSATNQSLTPALKTTTTDTQSDYLRYKIELCTNVGMSSGCQTFDQTGSQTGWSGQNTETSTAYTSGTQGTYTVQSALSTATTYYWRSYAIDPGGTNTWSSTQGTPRSFTTTTAPSSPTTPYAEGTSNPTGIVDLTPEFSAIHNDANADPAVYYEIEVNTASNFGGTVMWDTGQTSMSSLADGARSADVSYAGTTLTYNATTYYWRIRFADNKGAVGAWSATQSFSTNSPPSTPSLDSPADTATGVSVTPALQTTATDTHSDYLRYKIELCTNVGMSSGCQTFDQTGSQTGWSGQNTETSTAYTSGTQGTYTVQSALSTATTYYWRSYAIDPGGTNTWSSTQGSPYSFTTTSAPPPPGSQTTNFEGLSLEGISIQ